MLPLARICVCESVATDRKPRLIALVCLLYSRRASPFRSGRAPGAFRTGHSSYSSPPRPVQPAFTRWRFDSPGACGARPIRWRAWLHGGWLMSLVTIRTRRLPARIKDLDRMLSHIMKFLLLLADPSAPPARMNIVLSTAESENQRSY
jgi:hypothetical protein